MFQEGDKPNHQSLQVLLHSVKWPNIFLQVFQTYWTLANFWPIQLDQLAMDNATFFEDIILKYILKLSTKSQGHRIILCSQLVTTTKKKE